jgi:hypothetical protein
LGLRRLRQRMLGLQPLGSALRLWIRLGRWIRRMGRWLGRWIWPVLGHLTTIGEAAELVCRSETGTKLTRRLS